MLSPLGPALRDKKQNHLEILPQSNKYDFLHSSSMMWKKYFSVSLHTPPEVQTGIKRRLNAFKHSEILPEFISVPDCLAKLRNQRWGMVSIFSLLIITRAALPRTTPKHTTLPIQYKG